MCVQLLVGQWTFMASLSPSGLLKLSLSKVVGLVLSLPGEQWLFSIMYRCNMGLTSKIVIMREGRNRSCP